MKMQISNNVIKDLFILQLQNQIKAMQERTPNGQGSINRQADTFKLNVTYTDSQLKFILIDLVQWTVYQKTYTQSDIGKGQIHRKVQLIELYKTILLCEEKLKKQEGSQSKIIMQYKFGEFIKNGEIKYYKIQTSGKLTIQVYYQNMMDLQQKVYQSNLQLSKVREFSELQKYTQRTKIQKRRNQALFLNQINKIKDEKIDLENRVKKLEEENAALKQSMQQIKLNFVAKARINGLQQQLNKLKSQITEMNSLLKQKQPTLTTIFPLVNYSRFNVQLNQIKYIGNNNVWTQFIFNKIIPYDQQFVFKVKIVTAVSKYIMIGVVDYHKQKDKQCSYSSGNAVAYYGHNGYRYPSGGVQGTGFVQGQIVEVSVNLANKTIKWSVGGTQRASFTHNILEDKTRLFMPFVDMYNQNDIVQWV